MKAASHWPAGLLRSVSPVTYAVAITALVAALLYIASDAVRTFSEAGARSSLMASALTPTPPSDATAEIVQRGAIALGLAVFVALLSFRRRAPAATIPTDGYLGMLTSIREEQRDLARRYHEEKLRAEAASRSKTSFLAHLSHDIRTPLTHIIGFAELMRHQTFGPLGDARYVAYVESIRGSGERLLSFFASILDLAELEGGRRALESNPLSIDSLLVGVTQRFSAEAQRAHLTLALGAPCGASLSGDRFSLERMLGNLVENSIRFTPAGGRVTLAAYAADDGVVLEVSDTGIGMAPERLAALSQPFAFGEATLTKDREGAGLGLAIARAIAELSGGHLAIDSRPGLGTTVAISLPLSSASGQMDAAA
jgi:two-component system cell cycle sensor histidine kinase PleC